MVTEKTILAAPRGASQVEESPLLRLPPEHVADLPGSEITAVVHHLQLQQLDLKRQNEELRLTQEALERSRRRAQQLFDHAPEGYLILHLDGRIRDVNLATMTLLAEDASLMLGRKLIDYVETGQRRAFADYIAQTADTAEARRFEAQLVRKDRSTFWAALHCSPLYDLPRTAPRLLVQISDISASKCALAAAQDERRFAEAIVNTMHEPLLVLDGDLRVVRATPAFYSGFGCAPARTEGRRLEALTDGMLGCAELQMILRRVLRYGAIITDHNMELGTGGRDRRVLQLNARRLTRAGRRSLVLLAIKDITLRKQAERALIESGRRKEHFLALLGHELRSPIAAVFYACQTLLGEAQAEGTLGASAGIIDRQTRHLQRLVDDLLDISRINRDKIELRPVWIDVPRLIDEALAAVRPIVAAVHQTIDLELDPELTELRADPDRLCQILVNLLNNASKFSDAHERITLTAEHEGEAVVFRVKDRGIGIPEGALQRIFEPFQQEADGGRGKGLGLGLPLASGLAKLHGGSLEAISGGSGRGSEFVLRMPATSSATRAPRAEPRGSSSWTTTKTARRRSGSRCGCRGTRSGWSTTVQGR